MLYVNLCAGVRRDIATNSGQKSFLPQSSQTGLSCLSLGNHTNVQDSLIFSEEICNNTNEQHLNQIKKSRSNQILFLMKANFRSCTAMSAGNICHQSPHKVHSSQAVKILLCAGLRGQRYTGISFQQHKNVSGHSKSFPPSYLPQVYLLSIDTLNTDEETNLHADRKWKEG